MRVWLRGGLVLRVFERETEERNGELGEVGEERNRVHAWLVFGVLKKTVR